MRLDGKVLKSALLSLRFDLHTVAVSLCCGGHSSPPRARSLSGSVASASSDFLLISLICWSTGLFFVSSVTVLLIANASAISNKVLLCFFGCFCKLKGQLRQKN